MNFSQTSGVVWFILMAVHGSCVSWSGSSGCTEPILAEWCPQQMSDTGACWPEVTRGTRVMSGVRSKQCNYPQTRQLVSWNKVSLLTFCLWPGVLTVHLWFWSTEELPQWFFPKCNVSVQTCFHFHVLTSTNTPVCASLAACALVHVLHETERCPHTGLTWGLSCRILWPLLSQAQDTPHLTTLHKQQNEQIRDPGRDNQALWSLVNTGGDGDDCVMCVTHILASTKSWFDLNE